MQMMALDSVYIAAREVPHFAPGETVDIDLDDEVFPRQLSQATAGSYRAQAVLDVHHRYNYDGRLAGDLLSEVTAINLPFAEASAHTLTLSKVVPEPPDALAQRPDVSAAALPTRLALGHTQAWHHFVDWVIASI